jgi:hypothetical protein
VHQGHCEGKEKLAHKMGEYTGLIARKYKEILTQQQKQLTSKMSEGLFWIMKIYR